MIASIPMPEGSGSSPPRKPPSVALVGSDWPSPEDPDRQAFEARFWTELSRSSSDVAEAMANPLAFKFALIDSLGWTCDPATLELLLVNWRDPNEPLARRAAAFANAQLQLLATNP